MKLTKPAVKEKRQMVDQFTNGWSIRGIAYSVLDEKARGFTHSPGCACVGCERLPIVESVLRSYMLGEFRLAKRRGKS